MSKIKVKNGHFLAVHKKRRNLRDGGPLYATFPIKEKEYYLNTGWKVAEKQEDTTPATPPVINPPATITIESTGSLSEEEATGKSDGFPEPKITRTRKPKEA